MLKFGGAADLSSGDSCDSLSEVFYGSASDSVGRSSTGSIPWAEDAIRQNQEEWERIERMFYGEEDLPTDAKTRQEFLEWMTAFPHLRISGAQMPIYYDPERLPEADGDFEEVLCIDPPPQRRRKSYFSSETRSGHVARKQHLSGNFPSTSATLQGLQVSPGTRGMRNGSVTYRESQRGAHRSRPKSPDRAVNLSTRLQRLDIQKLEPVVRPPRRETLLQSRSSNSLLPGKVIRTTEMPVYHVTHRLEPMPPILNLRLIYRETQREDHQPPRSKGTSILPAIDGQHLAPQELAMRSISAINRRQMCQNPFSSGHIQSASRFKSNSPID
uniref:DUF3719 domain-containing protein n=1 Tax=Phlebotomus papatasi TaxID=29031 RepID=A0A1B0DHA1_PHLPP